MMPKLRGSGGGQDDAEAEGVRSGSRLGREGVRMMPKLRRSGGGQEEGGYMADLKGYTVDLKGSPDEGAEVAGGRGEPAVTPELQR
eukprot:189875-Pyramimonas_sp.AAC.1